MWGQVQLMLVAYGQLIKIMSKTLPGIFSCGSLRRESPFSFGIQLFDFGVKVKNGMLLLLNLEGSKPCIFEIMVLKSSLFSTN